VFLPDPQIGVRWAVPRYDALSCLHDPKALDLAVQVCQRYQPDAIVCLGDLLDAAPWGTYDTDAGLRQTTQPALAVTNYWLSSLRAVCPHADFHIIEGNHDARIRKAVARQLAEAEGVTADGDALPALDIRRLLGLEKLGIRWEGSPYDRSFYLWDRIRIQHGSVVRAKGGQTVASIASGATIDTVCGHIHRREQAARVVYGPKGPRVIQVMSPGCLTRTDGATPGRSKEPDWHQAIGFGVWDQDSDMVSLHSVPIIQGRMLWGDGVLSGVDNSQQIAEATGWHQLARGDNGKA
jgi:predicted phosphodiesterase